MMDKLCLLCQSPEHQVVFKEFEVDIVRCDRCSHVFSLYQQDTNYDGYFESEELLEEAQFWWNQAHQSMYQDFAEQFLLESGGNLLDIGCGLGYSVQFFNKYSNWNIYGCEISQKAVNFANQQLKLSNIVCGRVQEQFKNENSIDLITMWDVIEHLPQPKDLLSHCHKLLKSEGILFIHTPNIQIQLPKARIKKVLKGMKKGVHYLEAKDHIHIYSPTTLTTLLKQVGFANIEFIHLKPIQSVSGSQSNYLKALKNIWYLSAKTLYRVSKGQINLDNLFVVARK